MTQIQRMNSDIATTNRRESTDKTMSDNRNRNDELTMERRNKADETLAKNRLKNDVETADRREEKDINKNIDFTMSLLIMLVFVVLAIGAYFIFI